MEGRPVSTGPKVALFSGVFRFVLYQSTALDVLYIFGFGSRMIGSSVWLQIVENGRRERAVPIDSIRFEFFTAEWFI
jgi:hypothetical protein